VTFGGTAATSVTTNTSTSITATTPAHGDGSVDVVVTNPNGQKATRTAAFTFVTIPADGTWRGRTAEGSSISFTISTNLVTFFSVSTSTCSSSYQAFGGGLTISNATFSYSGTGFSFSGTILSTSSAQGTVQGCGLSTSWTATK
jgi:hypothetical protein